MPARKKAAEERSGHATSPGEDIKYLQASRGTSKRHGIAIPEPAEHWHPAARSWFNSLKLSGQSEFYEASDWATAVAAAQAYNFALRLGNASFMAHFVRLSERLGATVIDRKRSRIELEDTSRGDIDEEAADDAVTGWQGRLIQLPERRAK